MQKKAMFSAIILPVAIILIFSGCGKTPINQSTSKSNDLNIAQNTLLAFFDSLKNEEFDKAVELFEPVGLDSWEWLENFSPAEERNNKALVLKNYCRATGTCLEANILKVEQNNENEFILSVEFLHDDGEVFVLGPCCGATEEEMPPVSKFDFRIHKNGDLFKVSTPPVYVP